MRFTIVMGLAALLAPSSARAAEAPKIRVGIIGLDTSHVVAFTNLLNDPESEKDADLAGVEVVAAFPGGSADIPDSANRVAGFTKDLKERGVEIVASIDELLTKVDCVLLESVDGRPHLEQARPVFKAGKRMFIDKPMAGSLADAIEIFRLSKESGVPCFSSSSLRFSPGIAGMRNDERVGKVLGCHAYSPCSLEPHHPDLFWYGIHGVETLYTIMGTGCQTVTRVKSADVDEVTGAWSEGRIGSYRGIRKGAATYGALVFGEKGIAPSGGYEGYKPLVVEIARFFKSGKPPVDPEETIELLAFMEAADESARQGGKPVAIADVIAAARAKRK